MTDHLTNFDALSDLDKKVLRRLMIFCFAIGLMVGWAVAAVIA